MFVCKLSKDLFDDIFKRHNPKASAELAHDNSQALALALHLDEEFIDLFRVRDQARWPHVRANERLFLLIVEHVKDVHKTDDLIDPVSIDRNTRMALVSHQAEQFHASCGLWHQCNL